MLQAALLHDTIEDTKSTPEELEKRFDNEVRDLVLEVTDDKTEYRKNKRYIHLKLEVPNCQSGAQTGSTLCAQNQILAEYIGVFASP